MKRSVQGKLASATHSQTESYLRPLFRKLKKKVVIVEVTSWEICVFTVIVQPNLIKNFIFLQNLPADIKESITDIIKSMLEREYVKVCF